MKITKTLQHVSLRNEVLASLNPVKKAANLVEMNSSGLIYRSQAYGEAEKMLVSEALAHGTNKL